MNLQEIVEGYVYSMYDVSYRKEIKLEIGHIDFLLLFKSRREQHECMCITVQEHYWLVFTLDTWYLLCSSSAWTLFDLVR